MKTQSEIPRALFLLAVWWSVLAIVGGVFFLDGLRAAGEFGLLVTVLIAVVRLIWLGYWRRS